MYVLKLIYHINAFIKFSFFRVIYRRKLKCGRLFTFRKSFELMIGNEGYVEIGNNCFFNNYCTIFANNYVKIGDGTIFGESVKIYDHNHRFKDKKALIKDQGYSNGEVYIGNHCWIGSNVVILKGAYIGDNSVIGAGCVIDTVIPESTIVTNKDNLVFTPIN